MTPADFSLTANVVDIFARSIQPATIRVAGGRIASITPTGATAPDAALPYALPGFVDAHVHVESSLLVPTEFARLAVTHGTVATVSDPHEIGNVLGVAGVEYMLENAHHSPFKFCFGAPSCVPATPFETAGAEITAADIAKLFENPKIGYLAEMMNWPGVLHRDADVMAKIALAHAAGRPVDGHAPGLRGQDAAHYASAGISTDHECFTAAEARDKLAVGMKILIREGSAARNFDALIELMPEHYANLMFCSDDKHPDTLVLGHINQLVQRAVALGHDVFKVLRVACVNPVNHYNLSVGLLSEGDPADFITVSDLQQFKVLQTYLNGVLVAENGTSLLPPAPVGVVNNFHAQPVRAKDFQVPVPGAGQPNLRVIQCFDGQLITARVDMAAQVANGLVVPDIAGDVLKLAVINRYQPQVAPAVAFIRGFGLKHGALASSVGHDSHNITAVGCDDASLARAVNLVIAAKGGLAAVGADGQEILVPLPVAGLMSDQDGRAVASAYAAVDALAKQLGSPLGAPFMTLSFMALLVIPDLKLSDKGLFDGQQFAFVAAVE
ncbi:adenine deaminase [Hymenobacter sp. BT770]|uniref:adenine deaminase n=1 Tax=Hymenobacter sp. BT770 TaxID=2886942 RepID=UPI001D11F090|nr:adenine deaminase [Hymenobacter sp. BT770]MCC3151650.1 adenine deaminase [Hymenobacter sp. BT770]MDO3413773.1 adenine deaminase [Hymenobacter sp. BT770]